MKSREASHSETLVLFLKHQPRRLIAEDEIRVMKTQMRSRWEIFEGRGETREDLEPEKDRRKDQVTMNEEKGGRNTSKEYEQGGRTAGTPNVM